jgi:hypothetical protein
MNNSVVFPFPTACFPRKVAYALHPGQATFTADALKGCFSFPDRTAAKTSQPNSFISANPPAVSSSFRPYRNLSRVAPQDPSEDMAGDFDRSVALPFAPRVGLSKMITPGSSSNNFVTGRWAVEIRAVTRYTVDISPGTIKPIPLRMLAPATIPHTWLLDEGTMRGDTHGAPPSL